MQQTRTTRNNNKGKSQTECSRTNRKASHRLMESTKQEIGCGPYSSGVISLEGREFSCGRSNDPSSYIKKICRLFKKYLFRTFIHFLNSCSCRSTHRTSGTLQSRRRLPLR